jgi:hypothetical protein
MALAPHYTDVFVEGHIKRTHWKPAKKREHNEKGSEREGGSVREKEMKKADTE